MGFAARFHVVIEWYRVGQHLMGIERVKAEVAEACGAGRLQLLWRAARLLGVIAVLKCKVWAREFRSWALERKLQALRARERELLRRKSEQASNPGM